MNARLSDIQDKPQEQPPTKKQRVTDKHIPAAGGVSSDEKVSRGVFGPHDRGPRLFWFIPGPTTDAFGTL